MRRQQQRMKSPLVSIVEAARNGMLCGWEANSGDFRRRHISQHRPFQQGQHLISGYGIDTLSGEQVGPKFSRQFAGQCVGWPIRVAESQLKRTNGTE
jgi:hypothetical protein